MLFHKPTTKDTSQMASTAWVKNLPEVGNLVLAKAAYVQQLRVEAEERVKEALAAQAATEKSIAKLERELEESVAKSWTAEEVVKAKAIQS